jgi:DNA-binding transcriptional ArsR family regulator
MVESSSALDSIFHALSDATRRAILRDLSRHEKPVGDVAKPYPISLAAVSKHLEVLERANLIHRERQGNYRIVRLNPQTLRAAQDWLAFYETFWQGRLDALQTHLESASKPERKSKSWNP